jgi:hypothetical protein
MILLDDVVEVFDLTDLDARRMNLVLSAWEQVARGRSSWVVARDELILIDGFLPGRRVLLKQEEPLHLSGRAINLLILLTERADGLISNDKVMKTLSPRNAFGRSKHPGSCQRAPQGIGQLARQRARYIPMNPAGATASWARWNRPIRHLALLFRDATALASTAWWIPDQQRSSSYLDTLQYARRSRRVGELDTPSRTVAIQRNFLGASTLGCGQGLPQVVYPALVCAVSRLTALTQHASRVLYA